MRIQTGLFLLAAFCSSGVFAQSSKTDLKFDFGPGKVQAGYTQVIADMIYTVERGFGFEQRPNATITGDDAGQADALKSDFITSDQPLSFSVAVPEGNYRVTITL